jgi:hypothetical protein
MVRTLLLASFVLAGCKGDRVQCETACRNYGTLQYWDKNDPLIASAPADQRDAMRREKLADFETALESGVETCITQCVSANNQTTIDCMIGAKSAKAARACATEE